MIEHVVPYWTKMRKKEEEAKRKKKKSVSHTEVNLDDDNEESEIEKFASDVMSSSSKKNKFRRDVELLKKVFTEDSEFEQFKCRFVSSIGSAYLLNRKEMISQYAEFRTKRHIRSRLKIIKEHKENKLSSLEKKQVEDDLRTYEMLRNRLKDCAGDGDMDAFSKPIDLFLNGCRFCGTSPYVN